MGLILAALVLIWVVGHYAGSAGPYLLGDVAALAWLFLCVGGLARQDPVAYASIAVPPLISSVVSLLLWVAGGDGSVPALFGPAWIFVWSVFSARLWPKWQTLVLRRWRPGTPEAAFQSAFGDFRSAWKSVNQPGGRAALSSALDKVSAASTERTRAIADATVGITELAFMDSVPPAVIAHARRCSQDAWQEAWRSPTIRIPLISRLQDTPDPLAASESVLGVMFPRLDRIFRAASLDDQRRMTSETLRLVAHDAGLDGDDVQEALDRIASAQNRTESAAQLEPQMSQAENDPDDKLRWLRMSVLHVIRRTLLEDETTDDYALTVAFVLTLQHDHALVPRYEHAFQAIAPIDLPPMPTTPPDAPEPPALPARIDGISGVVQVAVIGFVAAFVATSVAQLAWPSIANGDWADDGYLLIEMSGTLFVSFLLVRVLLKRFVFVDFMAVMLSFVVGMLAYGQVRPIAVQLVTSFGPGLGALVGSTHTQPFYAALHGLTFAVALPIVAWLARSPSTEQRAK